MFVQFATKLFFSEWNCHWHFTANKSNICIESLERTFTLKCSYKHTSGRKVKRQCLKVESMFSLKSKCQIVSDSSFVY